MNPKESTTNYKLVNRALTLLSILSLTYLTFAGRNDKRERNERIKESQGYRCHDCGADCRLEVHHKIPQVFGGTNDDDNLVALGVSEWEGGCGCHDKWDEIALGR